MEVTMSGHSKWANIKHKKGKSDAIRGKIFTKIGREIAVAVKAGGPDPSINSKLYDVIVKARANNMPNDNIQRSIKKASGELGSINYESMMYEGYGIGGSAVIVETLTDNKTARREMSAALSINAAAAWALQTVCRLCLTEKASLPATGTAVSAKMKFSKWRWNAAPMT